MDMRLSCGEAVPEPFVTIVLLGSPRGKGRPRFSNAGQFVRVFTDAKTRAFESRLKSAGIEAMAGKEPLDEAVSVSIHAFMEVPGSWSLRKQASALAGDIMPTGAPDIDNLVKMLDGLNYHPPRFKGDKLKRPIIWHNDSQIVSMQAIKSYSDRPRLEISVWRWAD